MSPKNHPLPLLKHGFLALALLVLPLPTAQSGQATLLVDRAAVKTNIHSSLEKAGSFYFGLYGIEASLENPQDLTYIPQNSLPAYQALQTLAETAGEAIPSSKQAEDTSETNVLVAEVVVTDPDGQPIAPDLESQVYETITTEPGQTTTRSQLQQDINSIFATGVFADVRVVPEHTALGVKITFIVRTNPVLVRVDIQGSEILPDDVVGAIFSPQYGEIINLINFQDSIVELNEWYQANGYILAQVVAAPQVSSNGVVTLTVAEGVIEDIQVRFLNEEGLAEDTDGNPVQASTWDFIIIREFSTKPGEVFRQDRVQADLQRVFALGIFDDVGITLNPGKNDPRQVNLIVDVVQRNTGFVAAGWGFNLAGSIFATQEYQEDNLRGLNQSLKISFQFGTGRSDQIISSLTSPGSPTGLPMQGTEYENDLIFRNYIYQASNFDQQFTFQQSLEGLEKLIDISRRGERNGLLLLLLNNLGKARQSYMDSITSSSDEPNFIDVFEFQLSDFFGFRNTDFDLPPVAGTSQQVDRSAQLAMNSYAEAQKILQIIDSPLLKTVTSLNQAQIHRRVGNSNLSLQGYFEAINSLDAYSSNASFEKLLGDEVYKILKEEWLMDYPSLGSSNSNSIEYPDFSDYMDVAIPLVELFMLFDVMSIYSELGDYQSAAYVSQYPRLLTLNEDSTSESYELLNRVLFTESSIDSNSSSLNSLANTVLPSFLAGSQSILNLLPEIYRLRSLEFIFHDLGDRRKSQAYNEEIHHLSQQVKKQNNFLLYSSLHTIFEYFAKSNQSESATEIYASILQSLPSTLDLTTNSWNRDELNDLTSDLVDLFIASVIEPSDDIEDYRDWLDSLLSLTIEYLFFAEPAVYYRQSEERAIAFYQAILEEWPSSDGNEFAIQLEVLKGYILKLKADAHHRLGDYDSAIRDYTYSLRILDREARHTSSVGASQSGQSQIIESINQLASRWLGNQEFDASLNLADAYLKVQKYSQAKQWYKSALNFMREEESSTQLMSKESDYSEVFYGLAVADLLVNDFESARINIEQALILNQNFLPRVLSEYRQGSVDLTLRYGYGIPSNGLISAKFFTPWNPSRASTRTNVTPWSLSFQNRCSGVARHSSCRQRYFELYVRLLMTQHQNSPSQGFDALALEMAEQARISDYETLQSRLSPTSSSQYLSQRRESLGVAKSFRDIQAEIPDDETLVLSYFLGEGSSYLWLISKNELQTYALPPRDEIEAQAREFYDLLTSPPGRVRPRTTAAAGQQLSDMILGPVVDQLGQKRLVIVGDGFLQYLPFGALPNPAPSATPSAAALEGEFAPALNPLILEHEVVYLPSASALVGLRENRNSRPRPQQELAFFANPVFSHRDERVNSVRLAEGWEPFSPEELADVEVIYSQLPETERELEPVLASGLIPDTQVQKFWGYDASLEAALSPELGQHRIVHFASHGIFNSNAPDRSGVVLSGISETGVVQSGLLSPRHAFNQMDLSATDLVVLSGCRTGLSEGQMGREGVTGLTSGLMSAGADRVIASLWSVRDDATRELMQRFYAGMLDPENPLTPAAALRTAQISMWEEARWQAPYYWAAFTLQGEWE